MGTWNLKPGEKMLNKETNGWREGRFTYPTWMFAFPFKLILCFKNILKKIKFFYFKLILK
jgi:hypothetical protein